VYFIQTTEENVLVHFKSLTDINEQVAGLTAFNVVPSLTQGDVQVQFNMNEPGNVRIELFSVTGSMLATISDGYQTAGEQTLQVNLDNFGLSPGIYFVRIQSNGISYNQQIVYTN
jgi:hypothetical protein